VASVTGVATAQKPSFRNGEIYVISECAKRIRFFVRHAVANRRWINNGWWEFAPKRRARLFIGGQPIYHFTDHALYLFGYEIVRPERKWTGDLRVSFDGREYQMLELKTGEDDDGTTVTLTCD
jgi:hypothetical protein